MMTRNGRRCLLVFVASCIVNLSALHAQSTKAELFGILKDPSGLPVSGASVELTNAGTEAKRTVESDAEGGYHFFALPPGGYQISATKQGFRILQRDGVALRVGDVIGL